MTFAITTSIHHAVRDAGLIAVLAVAARGNSRPATPTGSYKATRFDGMTLVADQTFAPENGGR